MGRFISLKGGKSQKFSFVDNTHSVLFVHTFFTTIVQVMKMYSHRIFCIQTLVNRAHSNWSVTTYILLLQYWYEFHATHHGYQTRNYNVWSDLRPNFSMQWTFLSNNDSVWHHCWCGFCSGHSATCLVRIQNYWEWGSPVSAHAQRDTSPYAFSFCRWILSVRLPLNYP